MSNQINISISDQLLNALKSDASNNDSSISELLCNAYKDEKNNLNVVLDDIRSMRKNEVNSILIATDSRRFVNSFDSAVDRWIDHAYSNLTMKHLNEKLLILSNLLHDTSLMNPINRKELLKFVDSDNQNSLAIAFNIYHLMVTSYKMRQKQQENFQFKEDDNPFNLIDALNIHNRENVDDFYKFAFHYTYTNYSDKKRKLLHKLRYTLPILLSCLKLNEIYMGESYSSVLQMTPYLADQITDFFDGMWEFRNTNLVFQMSPAAAAERIYTNPFFQDLYRGFKILGWFDTDNFDRQRLVPDFDDDDKAKYELACYILSLVPLTNSLHKLMSNFNTLTDDYLLTLPLAVKQMLSESHMEDDFLLSFALLNFPGAKLKSLNSLPIQEALVAQAISSITTHRNFQQFVPDKDSYTPFDAWIKENIKFDKNISWQQELRTLQKFLSQLLEQEDNKPSATNGLAANFASDSAEPKSDTGSTDPNPDDLPM